MSTQLSQVPPSETASAFGTPFPVVDVVRDNVAKVRASWGWFVTFGIVLTLLGLAAMSHSVFVTLATALVFGYFLLAAGVVSKPAS
jgi:uncharacterized membrane protein HdeD (DUF308 family)